MNADTHPEGGDGIAGERTPFGGLARSELMSRVRSRGNRSTEMRMVKLLRENGLSGWRRHQPLAGRPDFVWRRERVVVFVDGCFWHGHDCGRNLTPRSNQEFWNRKIEQNRSRDLRNTHELAADGWTVLRIWECRLKKEPDSCIKEVARAVESSREQASR